MNSRNGIIGSVLLVVSFQVALNVLSSSICSPWPSVGVTSSLKVGYGSDWYACSTISEKKNEPTLDTECRSHLVVFAIVWIAETEKTRYLNNQPNGNQSDISM